MGHAASKFKRMEQAKRLLLETETGYTPTELADALDIFRTTAHDYLKELGNGIKSTGGVYTYEPTEDDIQLARIILRKAGQL